MFKYARYVLTALCLVLPCSNICAKLIDFSFTNPASPFGSLCIGAIQTGLYTITNNVPNHPIKINYIRIQNNDALPTAASEIITAPTNSCVAGTRLAGGASCNILVKLQPLAGTLNQSFNRVLQVGVDSRQVEIDAPITAAVNCTKPTPPTPEDSPLAPYPLLYPIAILSYAGVTNTGNSVVANGDVDVYKTSVTGLTTVPPGNPGLVKTGGIYISDVPPFAQAGNPNAAGSYFYTQQNLTCPASNNLTGQVLGVGLAASLAPGVYCFDTSAQLNGQLTLAGVDSNSTYTFQIGSTLTTASDSSVVLTGGVITDNINWIVGTSATLGTGTAFQGIIAAAASISLNTGASLNGRAWALGGAVTLQNNAITPF